MSTGQILGAVETVAGIALSDTPFGAPLISAGVTTFLGATLSSMGPSQHGPQLSDLNVMSSAFGVDVPLGYGTYRSSGNMIWASALVQHQISSGGGGKGGNNYTSYAYTLRASVAVLGKLIVGIRKIWANGNLIYNVGDSATNAQVIASNANPNNTTLAAVWSPCLINIHTGTDTQTPDTFITSLYANQTDPYYVNKYYFTGAPNGGMQVTVDDGALVVGGVTTYVPMQLTPVITPPASGYTQCALIVIDAVTGVASVVYGVAVVVPYVPVPPNPPTGKYAICYTTLTYGQVDILSVTDVRYNVINYSNIPTASTSIPVFSLTVGSTTTLVVPTSFTYIVGNSILLAGFGGTDSSFVNNQYFTIASITSVVVSGYTRLSVVLSVNTTGKVITAIAGSQVSIPAAIPPVPLPAFLDTAYVTFIDLDLSPYGQVVPNFEFEWIEGTNDLGAIVSDICSRTNLTSGQYDASQLTGINVDGYYIKNRQSARAMLEPLMSAYFFDAVESGPVIKFVPRWTNPVAVNIPENDLSAHSDGSAVPDSVTLRRTPELELPQEMTVRFSNINTNYMPGGEYARRTATESILAVTVSLPIALTDSDGLLTAQKALNVAWTERNAFTFSSTKKYCMYEPTDQVVLNKGSGVFEARITSKDETEPGIIHWTAVADDSGLNDTSVNRVMDQVQIQNGVTADPGNVTDTLVIDAPGIITPSGFELWIGAASNGPNWGGCNVLMATDNLNFTQIGRLSGSTNMGQLYEALPVGAGTDTVNTLSVDMTVSNGVITSWSASDWNNYTSLAYVDHELIAYETVSVSGLDTYNVTSLYRGVYGTNIASHAIGSPFMALDSNILKYAYAPGQVGATLYFKFQSFNHYGSGLQDPSGLTSVPYTIGGSISYPDTVTNFTCSQNGILVVFQWDLAPDPNIAGYEIRYNPVGDTVWDNATPVTQVTRGTQITTAKVPPGNFTFLIASRDNSNNYGKNPASFNLDVINVNTVIYQTPQAPDWLGTCTNFFRHWTGVLVPLSQVLASSDGWNTFDLFVDQPYLTCMYQAPQEDAGFDSSIRVHGDITSQLGEGVLTGVANPTNNINYRTSSGTYPGFIPWSIGSVFARYVEQKLVLDTSVGLSIITQYLPTIDNPVRSEQFNGVTIAPGGTYIAFGAEFHNLPVITAQTVAASGLFATVTGETVNGFTAHVFNTSDVDVGGTINATALGV